MRESVPTEREVLDRIRQAMESHLLENWAPEDVHHFLVHHWARLMTSIFMAKGNQDPDWISGWDTVNALIWSLSPKFGRQETEKMLRMLPAILARLHEGCAALVMPAPEQDAFFQRLAMMHAAVARDGLKYREGNEPYQTGLADMVDGTTPIRMAGPKLPSVPEHALPITQARNSNDSMPVLKVGDHVHFFLAKEDRVLKLNWVSPVGGMYMFANDQGLDALTLTRARLAERFHAGTARLV